MLFRCCLLLWALHILSLVALAQQPSAGVPLEVAIDQHIDDALQRVGIEAAAQVAEPNLVRRLTLDLAGRIPAAIEVQQYVASNVPGKRSQLVDRLMASDEFADYMATRLDWFITSGDGRITDYLRSAFKQSHGWDRIFRDVLLADLRGDEANGAEHFLKRRVEDTDRLTNDVSVAFFGVNISCAQCHDHFLAPDWKQDHYYGMKSFFARTFKNGDFIAERDYGGVKFTATGGEEHSARPMFLTNYVVEIDEKDWTDEKRKSADNVFQKCKKEKQPPPPPQQSLRQALVDIALEDRESFFFAKAIVNRIWYQLIGVGLVIPLDQMHSDNPPSHPQLLDTLARDLVAHDYDLRRLIRAIVMSKTYSRSSRFDNDDRPAANTFAVATVRPLTPTQLARSLSLATSDPGRFGNLAADDRAQKIAQAAAPKHSELFEQPRDGFQVSASESLWFTNSEKFRSEYLQGGLIAHLEQIDDPRERIEAAMWHTLARPATEQEVALLQRYIDERHDRPMEACRQIVWALLTTSEFRFNH